MHNDVLRSNCIVDNDKIVGLVDWKTTASIHVRIRSPRRENYAALDLPVIIMIIPVAE